MPRKIVRSSGPVITATLVFDLIRSMSCNGTGSITSTSPESRAATRVASDAIGVNRISLRLCSTGLRHQDGLGRNTVRTPGWWLAMTKGPVPFVCNEAWLGDVAEAGVGSEELFASAHFLSMMYQVGHWANKMGSGEESTKSIV